MSNGWSPEEFRLAETKAVIANTADQVVSKEFKLTAQGAKSIVIIATASAVAGGTITLKLQTATDSVWVDSKTFTIAAAGKAYLKLLCEAAADQTYLPLLAKGRIVATTPAAVTGTFTGMEVLQGK